MKKKTNPKSKILNECFGMLNELSSEDIKLIEEHIKRHKFPLKKSVENASIIRYWNMLCPNCDSRNWKFTSDISYRDGWLFTECKCEDCKIVFKVSAIPVLFEIIKGGKNGKEK
jgi:predicted  nucleic acid-binding Zn ribbon protein